MTGRIGMLSCVLAVASFVASGGSAAQNKSNLARLEARRVLAQVRHWGCQYQNIELTNIASSLLDLIVIDPNLDGLTGRVADRSEVQAIQRKPDGQRRLVVAYLSVGAAEEYRPYWDPNWQVDPQGGWARVTLIGRAATPSAIGIRTGNVLLPTTCNGLSTPGLTEFFSIVSTLTMTGAPSDHQQ